MKLTVNMTIKVHKVERNSVCCELIVVSVGITVDTFCDESVE